MNSGIYGIKSCHHAKSRVSVVNPISNEFRLCKKDHLVVVWGLTCKTRNLIKGCYSISIKHIQQTHYHGEVCKLVSNNDKSNFYMKSKSPWHKT